MLKLHPSRIFAFYLLTYIVFTAYFLVKPFQYDFTLITIAIAICLIFFHENRKIILSILFITVVLVANIKVNISNIVSELPQNNEVIQAQIIEEPKVFGKSQSFTVLYDNMKISVVTNQFPIYEFGETIEISGELQTTDSNDEYYGYYKSKNIIASYYYPKIQIIESKKPFITKIRKNLISIRGKYEQIISKTIPEPQAGLLSGILLGSRADLSDDFSNLMSKVGIIHIVALSGYNITIIAAFMASLGKSFSKKYAFWLSAIGIWAFVFATGLSASVVRAAIMGTLLLIASKFGRKSSAFISILFASALMIFLSPNILLYDIGFQLSFAAVIGILFLAPRLEELFKTKESYFGKLVIATFSAQIFTIPLISYYFERVSVVSVVTNFLVLPYIPLVMLVGFISSSVGLISLWLSEKLSIIVWVILSYIIKISELIGSISVAEIEYRMSLVTMFAIYIILFEIILILRKKKKYESK